MQEYGVDQTIESEYENCPHVKTLDSTYAPAIYPIWRAKRLQATGRRQTTLG